MATAALNRALGTGMPRIPGMTPTAAPAAPTPQPETADSYEPLIQEATKRRTGLQERIAGAEREQAALGQEAAQFRAQQATREAAGTREAFEREKQAVEKTGLREEFQRAVKKEQDFFFQPSQQNGMEFAALASLMMVLGTSMGKGGKAHSMAALSGLNGMMEGYRKGRDDVYKQERAAFETNAKALQNQITAVRQALEQYERQAATDRQGALLQLKETLAKEGADFVAARAEREGVVKLLPELRKQEKQVEAEIGKYQGKQADARAAAERERRRAEEALARQREAQEARRELRGLTAAAGRERPTIVMTPEGPRSVYPSQLPQLESTATQVTPLAGRGASASGPGGAIQFRYNAAMTNAGNALATELENAASLPLSATPPAAAEVLTNPAKGMTDAARAFFSQKITGEDARAMQQVFAGMQRAITTIEASGRPSGATEGAIREFGKTMPRAGDNRINTYLFLAQAKQVMNILVKDLEASGGSEAQIKQAKDARDRVSSFINWDVKDINNILSKGGPRLVDDRVQQAIQKSKSLSEFGRELKAKPGAPAAPVPAEAGGPYTDAEKERRYQEWKARQPK